MSRLKKPFRLILLYDDNGLLLSTTYPTGKTITNTYDCYGNLTGLTAMGVNVTWALTEHTGTKDVARIKVRSTGYPVYVTTDYDTHGYLKKQVMKYNYRNQILQSANYTFDACSFKKQYKKRRPKSP